MLLDNLILYEKKFITELGKPDSGAYFFFDYDDRSANINMEFQHFHSFYEIHILLDKEANHLVEGNMFHLKNFDITLLPPGILHKSEYPEGPAVKRLIIDFSMPITNHLSVHSDFRKVLSVFYAETPVYRFEREIQEQLASYLNDIFRICKSSSDVKNLQIHSELMQFLTCLYRYRDKNIYNNRSEDSLTSKIYAITSYIHTHFAEDLSLEELSKQFYISTYYLSHQFKEITGFTITNYIQMTRIRNAQQMLLSGGKKITDISAACGFNSFSQFNRVFNKVCGVSPSKFKTSAHSKSIK